MDGSDHAALTVAVLAGGLSTRMGQAKSFVPLRGKPMIDYTLERVRQLNLPVILIAGQAELYQRFGLPVYGDIYPLKGSLIGLHSAIYHSPTPYTLCVACDMPLLHVDLLRHLIALRQGVDAVVPTPDGWAEPLHAVYHRNCLPLIEAQIRQNEMQISRLYTQLNVRFVSDAEIRAIDPDRRSFTNANTPDELAAIEALL